MRFGGLAALIVAGLLALPATASALESFGFADVVTESLFAIAPASASLKVDNRTLRFLYWATLMGSDP